MLVNTYLVFGFILYFSDNVLPVNVTINSKTPAHGVVGGSVKLRWNVKDSEHNFKIYSSITSKTIEIAGTALSRQCKEFCLNPVENTIYSDRAKVTGQDGDGNFSLTISNLIYTDDGTVFLAVADSKAKVNLTLTVSGGPERCGGDDINPKYVIDIDKSVSATFNVSACGLNPKPSIVWQIGNDPVSNGSSTTTSSFRHLYQYKHKFNSSDCGKNISYEITGYDRRKTLSKSSPVYIKFTPVTCAVRNAISYPENNEICAKIEWEPNRGIGACLSSYEIQIYDSLTNETLINKTTKADKIGFCNTKLSKNMTVACRTSVIQTGFEDQTGEWSAIKSFSFKDVKPTTIPTTMRTTTDMPLTKSPTTSPETTPVSAASTNIAMFAGIGAGVGAILLICICCCIYTFSCNESKRKSFACCKPVCIFDKWHGSQNGHKVSTEPLPENQYASPAETPQVRHNVQEGSATVKVAANSDYEDITNSCPPTASKNTDPALTGIYADLGPGGQKARDRQAVQQSNYATVATDKYGNAIIGDINAPPPKRGIKTTVSLTSDDNSTIV